MIHVLLAALLVQAQTTPAPRPNGEIVVVGRNPAASRAALEECLRRKCPAKEDIRASLVHAENQFLAGDYEDAWVTVQRSRKRTEGQAKALPNEVSQLVQFSANMSALAGEMDASRVSTIDSLAALKRGLASDDPQLEIKRLEVGDAFFATPNFDDTNIDMARAVYDGVAQRSAARGWRDVQGRALLRAAAMYAQVAMQPTRGRYREQATRRLAELNTSPYPEFKPYRDAAVLLDARLAAERGDMGPLDRLIASQSGRVDRPMLVSSPRIELRGLETCVKDQWVDYEYRIDRDGRVQDVAERRRGERAKGGWMKKVAEAVGARRYMPLSVPADDPGLLRVERFVLAIPAAKVTGTRMRETCGTPVLQSVDITAAEATPS